MATKPVKADIIGSPSVAGAKTYFGNLTDFLNENATDFVTLASASTVDIGAAAGKTISVTGNTTIASFGSADAGITKQLFFTEALTLTYNAVTMILPGGVSIVTTMGDSAIMVSLGAGKWICLCYQNSAGDLPRKGGNMSGAIAMNGNKITGLADGTANGDAVRFEQLAAYAPIPTLSTGVGQWVLGVTVSGDFGVPAGGTWAYFALISNTSAGTIYNVVSGVVAGGTTVLTSMSGKIGYVLCWRVA